VVERAAEVPTLTEGPTVDKDGNLYFTEMRFQRIFKVDTKGELSVFREHSHGANGLVIDAQNRLIACEGAANGEPPRITRTTRDGCTSPTCRRLRSIASMGQAKLHGSSLRRTLCGRTASKSHPTIRPCTSSNRVTRRLVPA